MRNLCMVCVLCAFLGVAVNAQEGNGVFVGFEAGAGEQKLALSGTTNMNITTQATAILFGGKIGYKHFFLDWVGIRGYLGVDYAELRGKIENSARNGAGALSGTGAFSGITYSANVDALFNFYNSENVAVGAFVGFGLGGQTAKDDDLIAGDNKTRDMMDFYSDVKLGLRVNAAKNHGMEFIVKIPLNNATKTFNEGGVNVKAKYKQNYKILLGYNFTF